MKRLALALVLLTGGCRFWYKPVPVANAIGEEKTLLAGDSVHVYREARFEVYGPNVEAVYDGFEQLNRAYRAFERHFGAPAPRLAIVMADSTVPVEGEQLRAFRNRGFHVVSYARPRSVRSRRRYSGIDYGGVMWPIAPTAARAMLIRFGEPPRDDPPRSDSALAARYPLWYRAAVVHLVGEAGSFSNDLEYVREKRSHWFTFRDLFTLVRSPGADTLLDPSRRGEADEMSRIIAAQSSTLGRMLVEYEGPGVIGRLGRGYVSGRPLGDMLAEFRSLPRTVPEIEGRWKQWIDRDDY